MFEVIGFPHCGGFEQCNCSHPFYTVWEFGDNWLIQADNQCSLKFQILLMASLWVVPLSTFHEARRKAETQIKRHLAFVFFNIYNSLMITIADSCKVFTCPEGWNDSAGYLHYNWNIVPAGRGLERIFLFFNSSCCALAFTVPRHLQSIWTNTFSNFLLYPADSGPAVSQAH